MSQLLIRNLDSHVMNQLKKIAKLHHRSLQGEIKFILERVTKISNDQFFRLMEESEQSWPVGFFEEVVGGWKGKSLTRAPQGKYEKRDEFE